MSAYLLWGALFMDSSYQLRQWLLGMWPLLMVNKQCGEVAVFKFSNIHDLDADDFQNLINSSLFTSTSCGEIIMMKIWPAVFYTKLLRENKHKNVGCYITSLSEVTITMLIEVTVHVWCSASLNLLLAHTRWSCNIGHKTSLLLCGADCCAASIELLSQLSVCTTAVCGCVTDIPKYLPQRKSEEKLCEYISECPKTCTPAENVVKISEQLCE